MDQPGHFPDRLAALVEERRSRVVLGLDPDPAALWPEAVERVGGADEAEPRLARARTAEAVIEHCRAAIVAAGPSCVAVKPQLACFERLGAPGWDALEQVVAIARDHGLLVLADAKRGDVPVTAKAYGQALVGSTPGPFGRVEGLGVDAFTANPLLGRDALQPLIDAAAAAGAGCFVLVRTSNPGAWEIQDTPKSSPATAGVAGGAGGAPASGPSAEVVGESGGAPASGASAEPAASGPPGPAAPLHERLAVLVDELGADHVGDSGLSLVGAVAGATQPGVLRRLRELMPRAILLLPGVGAQGGRVEDLGPAFAPHPAAGLVTASRSIVDAFRQRGGQPADAAKAAAEELRETAWSL